MDIYDLILTVKNEKNSYFITPFNEKIEYFNFSNEEIKSPYKNILELGEERIKFLIGEYLKVRVEKIVENRNINIAFLSPQEQIFYEEVKGILILPERKKQIVAFIALENLGTVRISARDIFIRENDLYICFFSEIETFLYENKIQLL